jgi:hypothetical protein
MLFPRAPEDRDIRWIGIWRKRVGRPIERCPKDFPADELPDWAAIRERFGGGGYRVCAKNRKHRIICWDSGGMDTWLYMSGRSKPLSDEDDDEEDAAVPRPAPAALAPPAPPAPAPTAPPATDVGALMQMEMQKQMEVADRLTRMQAEDADRRMCMMVKMSETSTALFLAVLNREKHHEAAAPPAPDPLEAIRLGVELTKAQQATTPSAPPADPIAQVRAQIAMMKEMGVLTPARARSASSDTAEVQTVMDDLVAKVKAASATGVASTAQASQQPTMVIINGRCLTLEAAADEYARLMAGTLAPDAPLAPPVVAPAPVTLPPLAAAAPPPPTASPAEVLPSLSWLAAEQKPAGAPEAPSCGGAPPSSEPTAVSACDSLIASDPRETSAASSVVIDDEPRASSVAGHDPVSSSGDAALRNARNPGIAATATRWRPSTSSTEQPRREQPQHPQPIASPAPADDADDLAAVDRLLRSDPAARTWLRATVETDARAPLPEQPADLGYVAQAVEVIRESADGRAMLRAVVARAEHQPQADATTVHEAVPPPTPSASAPEAMRPPRVWSRSDDDVPTSNSRSGGQDATWALPRTSDEPMVGSGEALAASARSYCAGGADAEREVDGDAPGAEHDGQQDARGAAMQSTPTASTGAMRPAPRAWARTRPVRALLRFSRWRGNEQGRRCLGSVVQEQRARRGQASRKRRSANLLPARGPPEQRAACWRRVPRFGCEALFSIA